MEKLDDFIYYQPGHKRQGQETIGMFKAIYLKTPKEFTQTNLCWGDYVRIKYLRAGDKKPSIMYSE